MFELKKSLHNRTTNWNTQHYASLQRSEDLPLERLREKKDKLAKTQIFFSESAKRREKETQILTNHKTYMTTHIVQQTKHQLRHDFNGKVVFELQWIGRNLSMMRINYKLTKRTKTEEYKKSSKTNNIMNFKTIRYKLTALSNIIHLILT